MIWIAAHYFFIGSERSARLGPEFDSCPSPTQVVSLSRLKLTRIMLKIQFVPRSKHTPSGFFFYVLLTVYLSIILVINQLDARNLVLQ